MAANNYKYMQSEKYPVQDLISFLKFAVVFVRLAVVQLVVFEEYLAEVYKIIFFRLQWVNFLQPRNHPWLIYSFEEKYHFLNSWVRAWQLHIRQTSDKAVFKLLECHIIQWFVHTFGEDLNEGGFGDIDLADPQFMHDLEVGAQRYER